MKIRLRSSDCKNIKKKVDNNKINRLVIFLKDLGLKYEVKEGKVIVEIK